MSASSEYESTARKDYGPATSSENSYEHALDPKLTDMNVPSVRAPVLRAIPLSPIQRDLEPDSTNRESIVHSAQNKHVDGDREYHIADKKSEMPIESLPGIVRIEGDTLNSVARITYPIIHEADDSSDANYVENSKTTIIQAPLNAAIVQNVAKLPQNFTINVDASVGNITTIQNVSQEIVSGGSQTIWFPTIITTSAPASIDNKAIEEDRSQSGVSQIIIASESYETTQTAPRRANIVTDASYITRPKNSKVQILSNISLPKSQSYTTTQQYITTGGKESSTSVYGTQNHIYKLSTNVVSQKHLNNSVLCTKPPKSQSLIGCPTLPPSVINNSPIKNVSYGHTVTKGTNLNKALNKVNNGANLNTMVAASSVNTQCHILSRVVSGPNKVSAHSGGRKSVNTFKGSKNSTTSGSNPQKGQSRSIKIIQQTGAAHKNEGKHWSANVSYKPQASYGVIETSNSKIIQKVGSPQHKNHQHVSLQKVASKGERLVLQPPCGPVLISTAPNNTSLPRPPQYVQSGPTPNLRYVQTYGSADSSQISKVSHLTANQQLTAQILQSLSQPKMMIPASQNIVNHSFTPLPVHEENVEIRPVNQKRIVFGDPSTLLTADDIIGMEERPNLSEELMRYSFQALAFVMLDHTYALPAQKQPVSSPITTSICGPTVCSPTRVSAPTSPMIGTSPVITSTPSYETQPSPTPTVVVATPTAVAAAAVQTGASTYKPQPEEDAASVISSVDGDRRQGDRGGSDTETAPEGEEEGKTRCICEFTHDDGYMICCDRCGEWQHVDCMGIDRQNIPDAYMCELCHPRPVDRRHARSIQLRKREELSALGASDTDSSESSRPPGQRRKRLLTVTTYTNTSGACVTTYNNSLPVLPTQPAPTVVLPKRGPKKPKKVEVIRKGAKRKLSEKRVKRKKEIMLSRSKYNSNVSNQSHWQESYELAMTNHYSPELRAKIMKYSSKSGNTPNMTSAIAAHLCTTVPHAGGKILIATRDLKENTSVIELRGKYMLSNQHRPQLQNSARAGSQKPGPFVFFYRLPKDNTQVCIDTRTYGNEARFVRRSCKPNAELQHCIIKGALHVYLVSIGSIQSNTEITVSHDSNSGKQPCACGNPKHCKVNGLTSPVTRKTCEYPPREKRMRNRCHSSSSPVSPPAAPALPTPTREFSSQFTPVKTEKKSPIKQEYPPMSPVKNAIMALKFEDVPLKNEPILKEDKMEIDLFAKEELKPDLDEPASHLVEPKIEEKENPIEESVFFTKLEDIPMPAMDEEKIKIEEEIESKVENTTFSDEEKIKDEVPQKPIEEERVTRNSVTAKSACHDRSSRSSRNTSCFNQDSMDDKTDDSQDKIQTPTSKEKDKKKMTREERKMEAIMKAFERLEKAEQRKQEVKERQKRRESDPAQPSADRDDDDDTPCNKKRKKRKGRARTTSQSTACNRRRLNSADSDLVTSGDEGPSAALSPADTHDHHNAVAEEYGLSSACLFVEAAVGSVESAFKLPKTKKTMATEWIGRSPDRTPSPYRSPYRPSLVTATSLENLVKVASIVIGDLSGGRDPDMEGDSSPPRTPGRDKNKPPKKAKRITRNTPLTDVAESIPIAAPLPQHSAKKRWLRQAISEESDSPTAESPPNEMITPLKKRRMARESLSCEQSSLLPGNEETSPILTLDDSPVKDESRIPITRQYKIRNMIDSIYGDRDRSRSESGHGSDDQCHIDAANDVLNVNIHLPHDSENIRRIIGIPTPEDMEQLPSITKPEDIKTINNNVGENAPEDNAYNTKVVPMDIDTTITPQIKIIESNDGSNSENVKEVISPNEKINSSQSADTSGNSSPQRDEMDDIQKKIHSFHTENIQILKSRNKKPPKEKRKKVNLNFDLNMVDDQISVQLRTEDDTGSKSPEINGDVHDDCYVSTENIPLPPIESIPLPAPETIPLPEESMPVTATVSPETIPLPEEPMTPVKPESPAHIEKSESPPSVHDKSSASDGPTVPFSSRFSSTGLFSGIFSNMNQSLTMDNQINDNVPNMQLIKNAIDRTAYLDKTLFDKETLTPDDELKSVQEILTRVNNMDSNSSVILSGVLNSTDRADKQDEPISPKLAAKTYCHRTNDPRLNPPTTDKPKPVRRKLSITEYRKRQQSGTGGGSCGGGEGEGGSRGGAGGEWSSSSSGAGSLSPLRLDAAAAAAADDLEQRLHRAFHSADTKKHQPKGVFDAQPTTAERVREKLSSRLRREFGLALPDDEEARPPTALQDAAGHSER